MKVVVLGSGPAGLFAVHAAWQSGAEVRVISLGEKSPLYGAQYLHKPIPGVLDDREPINVGYTLRGSADDYKRKVYGQMWDGTVSPEDLAEEHPAWDIRSTYDTLWERWGHTVLTAKMDPIALRALLMSDWKPDLIVNSMPRPLLCHMGHTFGYTEIWAAGDAPELGISVDPYRCPAGMVICNAEPSPAWYRMSNVYGRTTVEWPGDITSVPVRTASRVKKPTRHDCNCWDDAPIIHVGRYGQWSKGVLSHDGYDSTLKEVDRMEGVESATAEAGA